ncbi:DUF6174 domain-containing protein [Streptomyces sp. NPDC050803]|uniref:DUF6174 domain-containing protein n=1 Tax=unclassified Streptomyces TaxID=2593676 RepID=UPI0034412E46
MTAVHRRVRAAGAAVVLIVGAVACGGGGEADPEPSATAWTEPASYAYTLTSTEQVLPGRFRVTVRDGEVAEAVGLDGDSRRVVAQLPGRTSRVPTIGQLLDRLEKARNERADTAEAEYAADGRPSRITLDWDENAIDDEAQYVISAYTPAAG